MCSVDEVSALVLDIGTSSVRAGYAGDDAPKAIIPSTYGYLPAPHDGDVAMSNEGEPGPMPGKAKLFIGQQGPSIWRAGMEVSNPLSDGIGASSLR